MPELPEVETVRRGLALKMSGRRILRAELRRPDLRRPFPPALAARLDRPDITGWARLHAEESATTLRNDGGRMLLTDGPFIDSKEYLAGLFLIEVDADALGAALRWERSRNEELFPHLYGELDLGAVKRVLNMHARSDGYHDIPELKP